MKTSIKKFIINVVGLLTIVCFGLAGCSNDAETLEEPIASDDSSSDESYDSNEIALSQEADELSELGSQESIEQSEESFSAAEEIVEPAEESFSATDEPVEEYELTGSDSTGYAGEGVAEQAPPEPESASFEEEIVMEAPMQNEPTDEMAAEDPIAPPEPVEEVAYGAEAAAVSHASSYGDTHEYIVQPGDTLGKISLKLFNTVHKWQNLAQLNDLKNPNVLHPGDAIKFEKSDVTEKFLANQNHKSKQFTVKKGDTLSKIAQTVLGSAAAWKYLWAFNKDKVSNPNTIEVGQVLSYIKPEKMWSSREAIATGHGKKKKGNPPKDAY